jgi:Mn-containing catalase
LSYAKWRIFKGFQLCCSYEVAPEQKARSTYENLIRLTDDPDVLDPLRFLREREIVHFQRFGEALSMIQDSLNSKNFYAFNPEFDKGCK